MPTTEMTGIRNLHVPDPNQWPDLAKVPRYGWRSTIAAAVLRRAVKDLPLRIDLGDGEIWGAGSRDDPTIVVTDRARLFARLGKYGMVGFGESYMAGEWDAADAEVLTAALAVLAGNLADLVPTSWQWLRRFALLRMPIEGREWRRAARENISAHYDLSNELFATFLDSTLTYSSALFADPAACRWEDLAAAQRAKIDRLLDRVDVGPGTRLLEIGTGWGELALRAADRGATVTTLTLSGRQAELAAHRLREAGLDDRVDVRLEDYRDVTGSYDAIVSVEMIEAVGYDQWLTYFMTLDRLLAPGGKIGLQAITMPDDRLQMTRHTYGWVHKYIFPGGLIPSVEAISRTVADYTDLTISDRLSFGEHYAATLRLWRERFDTHGKRLQSLGFDDVFGRMWRFYLCYSRAGFESGYLDVNQFVMVGKP